MFGNLNYSIRRVLANNVPPKLEQSSGVHGFKAQLLEEVRTQNLSPQPQRMCVVVSSPTPQNQQSIRHTDVLASHLHSRSNPAVRLWGRSQSIKTCPLPLSSPSSNIIYCNIKLWNMLLELIKCEETGPIRKEKTFSLEIFILFLNIINH